MNTEQAKTYYKAEQAAREYCTAAGHRAHLVGHSRTDGRYIETQDSAGQWHTFWQQLKQEPQQ